MFLLEEVLERFQMKNYPSTEGTMEDSMLKGDLESTEILGCIFLEDTSCRGREKYLLTYFNKYFSKNYYSIMLNLCITSASDSSLSPFGLVYFSCMKGIQEILHFLMKGVTSTVPKA